MPSPKSLTRRLRIIRSITLIAVIAMGGVIGQLEPGRYWGVAVPSRLDLYKHYGGWRAIGAEVSRLRARFPGLPLLGRDRMMVASSLYYVRPWPVPIYAWHPDGRIKNHFRLTRPWPGTPGSDALVISRKRSVGRVLARFRSYRLVATITVPIATDTHRRALAIHYMDATARALGGNREQESPENMPVVRGGGLS